MYSNGLSEVILGNAIKKLNLPREELVIMTKVESAISGFHAMPNLPDSVQLHHPVAPEYGVMLQGNQDDNHLVNQYGSNRKVLLFSVCH